MTIDPQLIDACKRQDRKAQSALYRQCFPMLMGICMRYYRNESEAVAALNLGFLKILNGLKKRKESVPFGPWACRIQINTIIDEYRRQRRHQEHMIPTDWESEAEPQGSIS